MAIDIGALLAAQRGAQVPPASPYSPLVPTPQPPQNFAPDAPPVGTPESRTQGWRGFLDRFQNDPELKAAALYFGTQLLQPRYGGQTQLGQIGEALQNSVDYVAANRQAQREQARLDAEEGRKQAATDADIASSQASTALAQDRNRRENELLGGEKDKNAAAIRASDAESALRAAQTGEVAADSASERAARAAAARASDAAAHASEVAAAETSSKADVRNAQIDALSAREYAKLKADPVNSKADDATLRALAKQRGRLALGHLETLSKAGSTIAQLQRAAQDYGLGDDDSTAKAILQELGYSVGVGDVAPAPGAANNLNMGTGPAPIVIDRRTKK